MLALLTGSTASAQSAGCPKPRTLRQEEDYSGAQTCEGTANPLGALKHITLDHDRDVYVSVGATLRVRQDVTSQPYFGLRDVPYDDFTTLRALVHADLKLTDYARVFVEPGSMWAFGRDLPERSVDEDRLDLLQGFVDVTPRGKHCATLPWQLTLRIGRQSFSLGSARLVSIRDGTNVRRSFDGVRVLVESSTVDAQLIAVSSPALSSATFDDAPSLDETLFGSYLTLKLWSWLSADVYYLGYRSVESSWLDATGLELRHSLGVRLFGRASALDYDDEAVLQLGSVGDSRITAWTVATDHGVTPVDTRVMNLRVGVRMDVASGDRVPDDGTLGTFSPLFPKLPYFSELALVSPSNLIDVHPSIAAAFLESLRVELGVDFFWRHRERDALYTGPNVPLLADFAGRFAGTQLNAEVEASIIRELTLTLFASHFEVSRALVAASAHDSNFLGFWSSWLL